MFGFKIIREKKFKEIKQQCFKLGVSDGCAFERKRALEVINPVISDIKTIDTWDKNKIDHISDWLESYKEKE